MRYSLTGYTPTSIQKTISDYYASNPITKTTRKLFISSPGTGRKLAALAGLYHQKQRALIITSDCRNWLSAASTVTDSATVGHFNSIRQPSETLNYICDQLKSMDVSRNFPKSLEEVDEAFNRITIDMNSRLINLKATTMEAFRNQMHVQSTPMIYDSTGHGIDISVPEILICTPALLRQLYSQEPQILSEIFQNFKSIVIDDVHKSVSSNTISVLDIINSNTSEVFSVMGITPTPHLPNSGFTSIFSNEFGNFVSTASTDETFKSPIRLIPHSTDEASVDVTKLILKELKNRPGEIGMYISRNIVASIEVLQALQRTRPGHYAIATRNSLTGETAGGYLIDPATTFEQMLNYTKLPYGDIPQSTDLICTVQNAAISDIPTTGDLTITWGIITDFQRNICIANTRLLMQFRKDLRPLERTVHVFYQAGKEIPPQPHLAARAYWLIRNIH